MGRKLKDPPNSRAFMVMAYLLEVGQAKTHHGAAIKTVQLLKISEKHVKPASTVDRLRKRFKALEAGLRERARQYIAERNRPPIPPTIGVGSSWMTDPYWSRLLKKPRKDE